MKEIVLSVKRQKTEIKIFCVCIALAYLMNIISIIAYGTSWSELWTQSLWMLLITCGFYGLSDCTPFAVLWTEPVEKVIVAFL